MTLPSPIVTNVKGELDPSAVQRNFDAYSLQTPSLRLPFILAEDYGLTEAGTAAANKIAIDAALAAATGLVVLPAYDFVTNGGHDIPSGVDVGVFGRSQIIYHRGSSYCFRLMDETSGGRGGGLHNVAIHGSSGGLAAVNGAIGVELSNGQGHRLHGVWIYGFTGTNSIGVYFHNIDGTVEYVEQCDLYDVAVVNCTRLIRLHSEASAGTSFGYNALRNLQLQVYDDQVAISMGTGTLYNSIVDGTLHYAGDDAIGLLIAAAGEVSEGTRFNLVGEMLAAHTGCKRISSAGLLDASGRFFIANDQPPDDTPVALFSFVEDQLTFKEAEDIHGLSVASAAALAVPPGSGFFAVTGTTNITSITDWAWEGQTVTFKFADVLTFTDGNNLKLNGNFVTSADDTITLVHRGDVWYEVARSAN